MLPFVRWNWIWETLDTRCSLSQKKNDWMKLIKLFVWNGTSAAIQEYIYDSSLLANEISSFHVWCKRFTLQKVFEIYVSCKSRFHGNFICHYHRRLSDFNFTMGAIWIIHVYMYVCVREWKGRDVKARGYDILFSPCLSTIYITICIHFHFGYRSM